MTRQGVPRTGKRFCRLWTPNEDAVLQRHYPDYPLLQTLLPDRTRGALEGRADALGIMNKAASRWTPTEVRRLTQLRNEGASLQEIAAALPRRSKAAVQAWINKHRISRLIVRPMTGNFLLDQVRQEAARRGMTLVELDRLAGTHRAFASAREVVGFKHLVSAIEALGGRIEVEWQGD